MTQTEKAGIIFPVGRLGRMLRDANYCPRVGSTAPVAMAAVIEYICQEIVELAGDYAKEGDRKRITPKHIQDAIRSDEELNNFFINTTIKNGGVKPHINVFLLKKKAGKAGAEPTQAA